MRPGNKSKKGYWITRGLLWGAVMFICMDVIYPLAVDETLVAHRLWKAAVLWLLIGLLFGLLIKYTRISLEKARKG